MTKQEKAYLKHVCKNCKLANKRCIKNDIYIGLCSENDSEELIELAKRRGVLK